MVSNTKLMIIVISSVLIVTLAVAAGIIGTFRSKTGRECSRRRLNVSTAPVAGFQGQYRSRVTSQGGGYLVEVQVGNPPQTQYLSIDTGSDVPWVQCADCTRCYPQTDPKFNTTASTSFCHKTCNSKACKSLGHRGTCQFFRNRCAYKVGYGDDSVTKGILMAEQIRFGISGVADVAMGCGRQYRGIFEGSTSGVMGLGNGSMSFVNQLGVGLRDGFTYCLPTVLPNGWLEFGSGVFPSNASWVPILRNSKYPSFYYIKLFGIEVGGVKLPVADDDFRLTEYGHGGVILDSGTTLTLFPKKVYEVLRDELKTQFKDYPRAPPRKDLETCYRFTFPDTVIFPNISFHFDSTIFTVYSLSAVFVNVDDEIYCFAFAPTSFTYSILGNSQQAGTQMSYDLRRGQVGFGPTYLC